MTERASIEKILKVQKFSHFLYIVHDILDVDDPIEDGLTNINFRNYAVELNEENMDPFIELGFNPVIEYLPIKIVELNELYSFTDGVLNWLEVFKSCLNKGVIAMVASNHNFSKLDFISDVRFNYPVILDMPMSHIFSTKYFTNSLIQSLSKISSANGINKLLDSYFQYVYSNPEILSLNKELRVNESINQFIDTLTNIDSTLLKIFEVYTYGIVSVNILNDLCAKDLNNHYHPEGMTKTDPHIYEMYKEMIDDFKNLAISDTPVIYPRKIKNLDFLLHLHQVNKLNNSKVFKDSILQARDIGLKFLEKEKSLFEYLQNL